MSVRDTKDYGPAMRWPTVYAGRDPGRSGSSTAQSKRLKPPLLEGPASQGSFLGSSPTCGVAKGRRAIVDSPHLCHSPSSPSRQLCSARSVIFLRMAEPVLPEFA